MSEYDKARDRVKEIHSRALILANEVDRLECERDELSAKFLEMQEHAVELQEERDRLREALRAIRGLAQWDYDDAHDALAAAQRLASEALAGTEDE